MKQNIQNKYTPASAAKAVRVLFSGNIARTWTEYFDRRGYWLNSYTAAKIVQEQCHCTFYAAAKALARVIPELYAEYWEGNKQNE